MNKTEFFKILNENLTKKVEYVLHNGQEVEFFIKKIKSSEFLELKNDQIKLYSKINEMKDLEEKSPSSEDVEKMVDFINIFENEINNKTIQKGLCVDESGTLMFSVDEINEINNFDSDLKTFIFEKIVEFQTQKGRKITEDVEKN